MTSGTFSLVPLDSIRVNRAERQRRDLEKVPELAESIRNVGLINPPVITRGLDLVAGERRLEACRSLGWLEIPVQFSDTLDQTELHLIELEENVKRVDLSWQDQNDAIAAYHKLRNSGAVEWSAEATASALGVSPSWVRKNLAVAKAREDEVDGVSDAAQFSVALGLSQRNQERKKATALQELPAVQVFTKESEAALPLPVLPPKRLELLNVSFLDWKPTRQFNLIHCDFPYGVNIGNKSGQSAAKITGTYADTPDIYFALLEHFIAQTDYLAAPSAHLLFWFSMNFYTETKSALSAGGWDVQPFPLIWHKTDNAGILPDKDRQPRRIYETAFLCSRGDRKLVRPVANTIGAATTREFHTSEKPRAVLSHFFRMLVDESTTLLDPTAGSANAVRVAEAMGAEYALGLEIDTSFFEGAKQNCGL